MKLFAILLALSFSLGAAASDLDDIHHCLHTWGKTPFAKDHPDFRIINSKVRVMGIGDNVEDTSATDKPELVLLKPAVSVMSKTVMKLMNPNGWYCIKGKSTCSVKLKFNCIAKRIWPRATTPPLFLAATKTIRASRFWANPS